jgi:uncharacterized membrane protein YphA (DoxX/SURF4 family)
MPEPSSVFIILLTIFIALLFLYSGYSFMNYRLNKEYDKTSGIFITIGYYIFWILIVLIAITSPVLFFAAKSRR